MNAVEALGWIGRDVRRQVGLGQGRCRRQVPARPSSRAWPRCGCNSTSRRPARSHLCLASLGGKGTRMFATNSRDAGGNPSLAVIPLDPTVKPHLDFSLVRGEKEVCPCAPPPSDVAAASPPQRERDDAFASDREPRPRARRFCFRGALLPRLAHSARDGHDTCTSRTASRTRPARRVVRVRAMPVAARRATTTASLSATSAEIRIPCARSTRRWRPASPGMADCACDNHSKTCETRE